LRIVADERIAALDESFGRQGELLKLPGRQIRKEHLLRADALLTRTVTTVDEALIDGTSVRFVGTATIGTDHLDTQFLNQHEITWSAAPGCNADATAQYTLAHFLLACDRLGLNPQNQRFGIVGCGNVGSRLRRLLEITGMDVVVCDPPLQEQGLSGFSSMTEILECDVISLHVPLTRQGRWPTYQMFDNELLSKLGSNKLLINACRGDVIEPESLSQWIGNGGHAALDVWPNEPHIDPGLIELATTATPHIAGYSLDGKLRATSMIYADFCRRFCITDFDEIRPDEKPTLDLDSLESHRLEDIVLNVCPIVRDDQAMRHRLATSGIDQVAEYDALRSHYPERRDFAAWTLKGGLEPGLESTLRKLGFSVTNH